MLQSVNPWNVSVPRSRFLVRRRGHGRRSSLRQFLPRIDLMEDRTLLSTVTITNNHDGGAAHFRAALAAATSGETINFANSLTGQTITLTSGELAIATSLDLDGPGAGKLTVSGGGTSRVFAIAAGDDVSFSGMTIANGSAVQGGGIDNSGTLSIDRCTLLNNQSQGGTGGGESSTRWEPVSRSAEAPSSTTAQRRHRRRCLRRRHLERGDGVGGHFAVHWRRGLAGRRHRRLLRERGRRHRQLHGGDAHRSPPAHSRTTRHSAPRALSSASAAPSITTMARSRASATPPSVRTWQVGAQALPATEAHLMMATRP